MVTKNNTKCGLTPDRLIKHGLLFDQVVAAVRENNRNVGGGNITQNSQMLLVHGLGRTVNIEQIENIVIKASDGVPIRVRDVASVEIGHEIRRGAVTADGQGEVVYGLGFMLMGENSHEVTNKLKTKMEEIKTTLPPGVEIETVYDRTELVDYVIETVQKNLFEGGLLVIAILFLFLGNLRGWPHCRFRDSVVDAVRLFRHASLQYCGKLIESWINRLWLGCR